MASEVVCGLVFRLLLPICLAVGECGVLMEVMKEDRRGPELRGFVSESRLRGLCGRGFRYTLSGVCQPAL